MRPKFNAQAEFDFQPSNLKLTNAYYAKYQSISTLLQENPELISRLHADLAKPLKYATVKGLDGRRHRFSTDQVLRLLLCQVIEGASLREIIIRIDDSNFLRRFTRVYNGPMMDYTTLDKLKNSIRPETWHEVNRLLGQYAVQKALISGGKLRIDTTAVETNIHYPTDSSLLWDTYRVLARLITRARELDSGLADDRRLQCRRAKRLHQKISRRAAGKVKTDRWASKLKSLYQELLGLLETVSALATEVRGALQRRSREKRYSFFDQAVAAALMEQIDHYLGLGARVQDQARRRVLMGQNVPNDQKLFSIFEPHTELLKRGKAGKDVEFGHMIEIRQVPEKFITGYDAFEKKPVEHELLEPALKQHRHLFGEDPKELSADKGYYESAQRLAELRERIAVVAIGKKGRRTEEETEIEHEPAFRHAQRFRAGVEGTISFLKRILGLFRCYNKGWDHFAATVGAAIFSHNLLILSRG
jgi:IS5 family transposase